jgi:hypothetical protein
MQTNLATYMNRKLKFTITIFITIWQTNLATYMQTNLATYIFISFFTKIVMENRLLILNLKEKKNTPRHIV